MMEILFRGKRIDTGEWVYGDFYRKCGITGIVHDYMISTRDGMEYPVIPETIGQYTGLDEKRPHVDHLIRHKWPEEKPEKGGQYLIRIISPSGSVYYSLRGYEDGEWHNFGNYLTHWWNLPEVRE